jgi:sialate O-acetylesterase
LIHTTWGGTRIEPWSTPEGLASCGVAPFTDEQSPETSNSYLFNAMINPFLKFTIYGVLWYQGKTNILMINLQKKIV